MTRKRKRTDVPPVVARAAPRSSRELLAAHAIVQLSRKAAMRCRRCLACAYDCGSCLNCIDKVKFGGCGGRKQACQRRPPCVGYPCIVVVATPVDCGVRWVMESRNVPVS